MVSEGRGADEEEANRDDGGEDVCISGTGEDRTDDMDERPFLRRDLPPFNSEAPLVSLPHSVVASPAAWLSLGLNDHDVVQLERRYLAFGTERSLTTPQRAMLSHCISAVAEETVSASEETRPRWCALLHLLPRMLTCQAVLRRASAAARPFWRTGRRRRHQRTPSPRGHGTASHADATFRDRCYAFLTGDWAPLLHIPAAARRLVLTADDDRLTRDVLALIHAGELSRAVARSQAVELAQPVSSTLAARAALHPPDDHSLDPGALRFDTCPLDELAPPPTIPGIPSDGLSHDAIHEVLFRRLPRCSAADHAGWRYEYLSWTYRHLSTARPDAPPGSPHAFVPGRGAVALTDLLRLFFSGGIPTSVRPWFLGGRLIALTKEGDDPSSDDIARRRLRPIAIGSTIGRAVSMVAAFHFRPRFASFLQPPPPGFSGAARCQPCGAPWPAQVGVACRSGLECLTHSVRALLDEHPDWVDVALDIRNAFNSIHRRAFLRVISEHFPGLWDWVYTCYGAPSDLFVRRDGLPPAVITSSCGTRQGDPLGAQLFALGLHPVLCALAALIGDRGMVLAYADDIHILAPPSVIAEVLPFLTSTDERPAPPAPLLPTPDPRLISTGLHLAPGKGTIYAPHLSNPLSRACTARTLANVVDSLGDPLHSHEARCAAILRGDGSSVTGGHAVLGAPVGTEAFTRGYVEDAARRASSLLSSLSRLLVQPGGRQQHPDEFGLLLRFCIHPRLRHFLRTLPPGQITQTLADFQAVVVDAHLSCIPATSLAAATDIDPYRLSQLAGRFGGHGITGVGSMEDEVSFHDAAWYGSWAAVWHYIRAWVPALHGRQLAHTGRGTGFAYQQSVGAAWDRIARAHKSVQLHPSFALLPEDAHFPTDIHSNLIDGRLSPATCPLGLGPAQDNLDDSPDSPDLLYDLDSLDKACHPHAQRAASAVVMSREFLSLYSSSTPIGRARLLDGSVTRGPFSFWRRIPIRPEASASEQPHFAFSDPADYPIALALDLLLLPALQGEGDTAVCSRCVPSVPDPSLQTLGCRHFVGCPHGIRLGATCHDQAVRTLADCFSAILGSDKVIADRGIGTGQAAIHAWRQGPGASLYHTPDIVLVGLDGPGRYTLIEVKTFDVAGATHLTSSAHPDRSRLTVHAEVARLSARDEYRTNVQPLAPAFRLIHFPISTFGSIGASGQQLLADIGRRVHGHVPASLLPQATWATPRFTVYARMAVTFAVRRGLAEYVRQSWVRIRAPPPPSPATAA